MGKRAKNKQRRVIKSAKPSVIKREEKIGYLAKIRKKYDWPITIFLVSKTIVESYQLFLKDLIKWFIFVIVWIVNAIAFIGPIIVAAISDVLIDSGWLAVNGVLYYLSFIVFTISSVMYLQARYGLFVRIKLVTLYIAVLTYTAFMANISLSFWIFGFVYCCAIIWMPTKLRQRLIKITSYTF